MTGIFEVRPNGKHIKDVEIPIEISDALNKWWWEAKRDDEFIIRCELPV